MTPWGFAIEYRDVFRQRWDGVRDADRESVHEARVALRRVRAAFGALDEPPTDALKLCRYLSRALGRVRELDVTDALLSELGTRLPAAACAIAAVRRDLGSDRLSAGRRLVKALDDIELRPLARLAKPHRPRLALWNDWRTALFDAIREQALTLHGAVHHAPAVYMPNRLHSVRIALKKFRYTLEVAGAAAIPIDRAVMRDVRKSQESLGRLHDLHVAHQTVRALDTHDESLAAEVRVLDAVIAADCAALHATYLAQRDRLRALCDYGARLAASRPRLRATRVMVLTVPAAALLAVPVAMWRLGAAAPEGSRP